MKKAFSVICLMLSALLVFAALAPVASFADETYTKRPVDAVLFKEDAKTTIDCVFSDSLPFAPYVDPVDYINTIYNDTFAQKKNDDGTFTVYCDSCSMVFDVDKETIWSDSLDAVYDIDTVKEGSTVDAVFDKEISNEFTELSNALTLDFSPYGFDFIEYEGKVYVPLHLLSVFFSPRYVNVSYFNDTIYFFHDKEEASYFNLMDKSFIYSKLTRSKEEAEFSYAVLCVSMDMFFGCPSNAAMSGVLKEKGFDRLLEETDDNTRLIKKLLLSERTSEYLIGLAGLFGYFSDGGHTIFCMLTINGFNNYPSSPVIQDLLMDVVQNDPDAKALISKTINQFNSWITGRESLPEVRKQEYAKYADNIVKTWDNGDYLIVRGDTAVFVFDHFKDKTPPIFKEALDLAQEKGVKNFVLDVSCNGGGLVSACGYIFTLMNNKKAHDNTFALGMEMTLTGSERTQIDMLDLNLDGVFDDADKQFCYDFNFGVLTSWASFSCGNMLPVRCKDAGIVILGDTSGGGACMTTNQYLPDGYYYSTSNIYKNTLGDIDFDLGAAPDYVLTRENADGSIDYTGLYDVDRLGDLVEEYYASQSVDAGVDPLPVVLLIVSLAALATLLFKKRREERAV